MGYYNRRNPWDQVSDLINDAIDSLNFDRVNQQIRQNADDVINGREDYDADDWYVSTDQDEQEKKGSGQSSYSTDSQNQKYRTDSKQYTQADQNQNRYENAGYGQNRRYAQNDSYDNYTQGHQADSTYTNTTYTQQNRQADSSYTQQNYQQNYSYSQGRQTNATYAQDRQGNTTYTQGQREAASRKGQASSRAQTASTQSDEYGFPVTLPPKGEMSGWVMMLVGGICLAIVVIWMILALITAFVVPSSSILAALLAPIPFLIIFVVITYQGKKKHDCAKRYRKYLSFLKGKSFESFENLAAFSGKKEEFISRDVAHMLNLGYFPQGHLDVHKTCLMLTDDIYMQYLEMIENVTENTQNVNQKRSDETKSTQDDEKVRELEAKGREYKEAIRRANDDIEDVEISNKLYRMEMIIDKIFDHVKKYPQKAGRLRQFEDYYMPMTIKLLETYRDLDGQQIEGENIKKVKQEIAGTLDTINEAYEKLYDSMYQEVAMDVSSDISVLQTLLAQEGLTKGAFDQNFTSSKQKKEQKETKNQNE